MNHQQEACVRILEALGYRLDVVRRESGGVLSVMTRSKSDGRRLHLIIGPDGTYRRGGTRYRGGRSRSEA